MLKRLSRDCTAQLLVQNLMHHCFTVQYLTEKTFSKMDEAHRNAIIDAVLSRCKTFCTKTDPLRPQPLNRENVKSFIQTFFTNTASRHRRNLVKGEKTEPAAATAPPAAPLLANYDSRRCPGSSRAAPTGTQQQKQPGKSLVKRVLVFRAKRFTFKLFSKPTPHVKGLATAKKKNFCFGFPFLSFLSSF